MEGTTVYVTTKIVYDEHNQLYSKFTPVIQPEFMRLRNLAADALNPHYEKWNAEFGDRDIPEDDELKDYGGTEYCRFIQSKTEPILQQINKKHGRKFVELCAGEYGDIEGRFCMVGGKKVHFVMELFPVNI